MDESEKQPFHLSFNRFLRVAFQGSRVTSEAAVRLSGTCLPGEGTLP